MIANIIKIVTINIKLINNLTAYILINYKANVLDSSKLFDSIKRLRSQSVRSPKQDELSICPCEPRFQIAGQYSQGKADTEEHDCPENIKEELQIGIGCIHGGSSRD